MMMECKDLINTLGFTLYEESDNTLYISTPLCFHDGEPLGFYLKKQNNNITLSDDADTLFKFVKDGYDMRQRWAKIGRIVQNHNLNITNGEIHAVASVKNLWRLVADFMQVAKEIIRYENKLKLAPLTLSFVDEVATALEKRGELTLTPKITGASLKEYHFNFYQNATYIDVLSPHQSTTGGELRKLIDIQLKNANITVLIVFDDRHVAQKKLDNETLILNGFANITNYSDFIKTVH